MKITTNLKKLLFVALTCGLGQVSAQTDEQRQEITKHYDLNKLKRMAVSFEKEFQIEQEEAMNYAAKHNIPMVIRKADGGISVLQKILPDGTPLYYTTHNRGASITTKTNELYQGGDLNLGIHGEGMIVALWDGGVVLANHELLENRVTQLDNSITSSDHATHVAGTLIGSEDPQTGNARGMAFEAEAWSNDYNNDLAEMTNQAAQGLLVSNHSYGFSAEDLDNWYFGAYVSKSASVDNIAYNAPYYTIVKSAGNDRNDGYNVTDNGYDLLTDFGVSKNVIVVAAVNQVNNYTGPSSVVMSNFSSWGPPDDGRIKPDLSAKGVNVFSSIATGTNAYNYYSGTSMSSPNVAGSLILLQQLHNNLYSGFMRSATLRAIAIHSVSEAGSAPGPDYKFGWGLLNMEKAARVLLEKDFRTDFEENTLAPSTTYSRTITASGNAPIVVTLAWNDPAGPAQSGVEDSPTSRLVNDLDVRIEDESGNIYFPWRLNKNNFTAAATKEDNTLDNVEKIEIATPNPDEEYTITVSHKGTLTNGSQDYSLVVSGFQDGQFAFTPEFLETTICDFEDALISFNFVSAEDYPGPTNLSVSGLPDGATAVFSPSVLSQDGIFTLEISDLLGTPTGSYPITITATGPGFTREIDVELYVVNASPLEDINVNFPEDGAEDVFIYPTFEWTSSANAQFYELEISTQPDFSTIFFNGYPEGTELSIPGLLPETQYFWRMRPANECVEGNYVTGSFTTEGISCATPYTATDTPKSISFLPQTVNSHIVVPESQNFTISDVNVTVNITHSHVADFDLVLTSPNGTQVLLVHNACGGGDNVNATFDDQGSAFECADTAPVISGTYEPLEPLSNFIGEESAGTWTLSVIDEYTGDGGSLNQFTLEICESGSGTVGIEDNLQIKGLNLYPNPAKNYFSIAFANAERNVSVTVFDVNGRNTISRTFDNNDSNFDERLETSGLSSGIYFVKIINGTQTAVKKLIIE